LTPTPSAESALRLRKQTALGIEPDHVETMDLGLERFSPTFRLPTNRLKAGDEQLSNRRVDEFARDSSIGTPR